MNILQYAFASEAAWADRVAAMSGYQRKTTFWSDFTIAEKMEREKGIRDTYKRAFQAWKDDVTYMAELVLVLNHKIWDLYEKDEELARVYNELWEEAQDYAYEHFTSEEDSAYLFNVLD